MAVSSIKKIINQIPKTNKCQNANLCVYKCTCLHLNVFLIHGTDPKLYVEGGPVLHARTLQRCSHIN